MTVTTPLYAMVNRLAQLALQEGTKPSPQSHYELLQTIDQLRLTVETPTETVLRLIYQVQSSTASSYIILDLTESPAPAECSTPHRDRLGNLPAIDGEAEPRCGVIGRAACGENGGRPRFNRYEPWQILSSF